MGFPAAVLVTAIFRTFFGVFPVGASIVASSTPTTLFTPSYYMVVDFSDRSTPIPSFLIVFFLFFQCPPLQKMVLNPSPRNPRLSSPQSDSPLTGILSGSGAPPTVFLSQGLLPQPPRIYAHLDHNPLSFVMVVLNEALVHEQRF